MSGTDEVRRLEREVTVRTAAIRALEEKTRREVAAAETERDRAQRGEDAARRALRKAAYWARFEANLYVEREKQNPGDINLVEGMEIWSELATEFEQALAAPAPEETGYVSKVEWAPVQAPPAPAAEACGHAYRLDSWMKGGPGEERCVLPAGHEGMHGAGTYVSGPGNGWTTQWQTGSPHDTPAPAPPPAAGERCGPCAGSGKRHSIFDFCGCDPECEGLGVCGACAGTGAARDPGGAR
jgi:hypothetical protein